MGVTRRAASTIAATVALGLALLGVTAAVAVSDDADDAATGADADGLLTRLDELELVLPATVPPSDVTIQPDTTWGELAGDAGSVTAVLDTLEGDLRALFVEADDANDPVADAVASVARGWLEVWHGTAALAEAEAADLAFPTGTADDDDVATGADERRGPIETGLELLLTGRQRHLEGYTALRELGAAEPDAQARLDGRAADAEAFDQDVRPLILQLLSQRTTAVLVPQDRFDTSAPGVEARARSFVVSCIDREAAAADDAAVDAGSEGPVATDPGRVDCPGLEEASVVVRESR